MPQETKRHDEKARRMETIEIINLHKHMLEVIHYPPMQHVCGNFHTHAHMPVMDQASSLQSKGVNNESLILTPVSVYQLCQIRDAVHGYEKNERGKGMNETKRRSVAPSTSLKKKSHDVEESPWGRNS